MHLQIIYKMYKENLALNNLQGLIYQKTQPNCLESILRLSFDSTTESK